MDISWSGISGDASSMVLEGVTGEAACRKEGLAIGNITLQGISDANGGYLVEQVYGSVFQKSGRMARPWM